MTWDLLNTLMAAAAVGISAWTFYATLLKRGTVMMTRPTVIFFGWDRSEGSVEPKVFLRFLLYSTSRRGRVVENIYARVKSPEASQVFPIWVYGDKDLNRGSGIFVGPEGVATNHHFLLPKGANDFRFQPGTNKVEIAARLVGESNEIVLGKFEVSLSDNMAFQIKDSTNGVYFDWGGENQEYVARVDKRPELPKLPDLTPSMLKALSKEMEGDNK